MSSIMNKGRSPSLIEGVLLSAAAWAVGTVLLAGASFTLLTLLTARRAELPSVSAGAGVAFYLAVRWVLEGFFRLPIVLLACIALCWLRQILVRNVVTWRMNLLLSCALATCTVAAELLLEGSRLVWSTIGLIAQAQYRVEWVAIALGSVMFQSWASRKHRVKRSPPRLNR